MRRKYPLSLKFYLLLTTSLGFISSYPLNESNHPAKNRSWPVKDPFENLKLPEYDGDYQVHQSCHTIMCEISAPNLRRARDFEILEIASGNLCTQLILRNRLEDGRADQKYLQDENLLLQVQHIRKEHPSLEVIAYIEDNESKDISFEEYFYKSTKQETLIKSVGNLMRVFNFTGIQLGIKHAKSSNSKWYKKSATSLNGFLKMFSELSQKNSWTFDGLFRPPYIDALKVGLVGNVQKHFRYLTLGLKQQTKNISHIFPLRGDENSLETVANLLNLTGIDKDKIVMQLPFYAEVYEPEINSTWDANNTELVGSQGELLLMKNLSTGGYTKFNDICRTIYNDEDNNWTLYNDTEAHSMFLYNFSRWISTETTSTLTDKVGYLMSLGITRFALNDIIDDDYLGKDCGVKFPLSKSVLQTVIPNSNCTGSKNDETKPASSVPIKNDSTCGFFVLLSVSAGSIAMFIIVSGTVFWLYKCWRQKKGTKNTHRNHKSEATELQAFIGEEIAEWEIPPHEFQMYPDLVLGHGQFNIVLKGKILNDDVAVKMPKRNTSLKQTIPQQLNEIGIIKLLSGHKNILGLLGISTKLVEKGYIYQFLEFCPLGSLEKYLKSNREKFINFINDDELQMATRRTRMFSFLSAIGNSTPTFNFNTKTLMSWAYQICDGMEYVSGKNIVHGDLAARNILLQSLDKIKICDFGLSRKLNSVEAVVQNERMQGTGKDAMPWRWLPYETLDKGTISLTSDVWSFGVTVWEIFSLGEVPYAGLEWNSDFLKKLKDGLRLQTPRYSTSEMYKSFMLPCWEIESEDRPSFPTIKANISHCIQSFFSNGYEDVERSKKRNTYEENVFVN